MQTRPFDLDAALRGAPFIHRHDLKRPDAAERISKALVPVSHPKAPDCWLAFCSREWVVFDTEDEMRNELLLVVQ